MAAAAVATLHYYEPTMYKAQKALVAAKFNGLDVKTKSFDPAKDAKSADFQAKNPTGKVPFLETEKGCVFTSNAVARYIARCRADTAIYGKSFADEGAIDTWLDFCIHEVEVPLMTWVYPTLGLLEDDAALTADAKADVKKALSAMEAQLGKTAFLVGDFVTLADIALVCALLEGFRRVFDPVLRKGYPKVSAWFEKCCKMPQFKSVVGEVKLCTEVAKPVPVKAAPAAAAAGGGGKSKASAPAPKAEAKAAPAKAAAPAAPAAAPAAASGDVGALVEAKGNQIRALKAKLKEEGLSSKKVDANEEVKALVAELQALKAQQAAGGGAAPAAAAAAPKAAAAPAAPAPTAAPAAPAGGDIQAQVEAKGNEIRAVKAKLKAEGLSSKKIDATDEVKALVAELQALKAQL